MVPRSRYIGQTELPWDDGTPRGPVAYWRDVAPVERLRVGTAPSDLALDHVFFNAGLLQAATGRDIVALHWAETPGAGDPPYRLELGCRLFAGEMGPPHDRVLYACPGAAWPALRRTLDRFGFAAQHGKADAVWASTTSIWPVLDPVMARRLTDGRPAPKDPPLVAVYLYGLAAPHGTYEWVPSRDHWAVPPRLVWTPKPGTTPR